MTYPRYSNGNVQDNYAGICVVGNATVTIIPLVDSWAKVTIYGAEGAEKISQAVSASDHLVVGATGDYQVHFNAASSSAGANKVYEYTVFEIDNPTPKAISDATAADPVVITTSVAHGLSNGDKVKISGVGGMLEINDRIFTIADKTDTTFELQDDGATDIDGGLFTAYTSGGNAYEATETVIHSIRKFGGAGDIGHHGALNFIPLTINKTMELYIKGTSDATNTTVDSSNLSIQRAG